MKRYYFFLLALPWMGCSRTMQEWSQDTKTASRYAGQAVMRLAGQHAESRALEKDSDIEGGFGHPQQWDAATPVQETTTNRYVEPIGAEEEIFAPIHFAYDDDHIRTQEAKAIVQSILREMKSNKKIAILIEGHCDQRGSSAYNLSLGSRRALAVRTLLQQNGIAISRIETVSYGKERLRMHANTEAAWAMNRRVEFKIKRSA